MRTRKSSKYKFTDIRLTRIDFHICTSFVNLPELWKIREVKFRVNSLCKHIKSHCNNVKVTGSLAVAEECALYTLCTCKKCKLARRNACASVIVRMQADYASLSVLYMFNKIFNLICVCVWCAHFNSVRKIEDNRAFFCRTESFHNFIADVNSVLNFCTAETFGRILKSKVCIACIFVCKLLNKFCAFNSNFCNAFHICFKYNFSL